MKKVFLLLLCAATMLLVACNDKKDEPNSSGTQTTTTDNPYPYMRVSDLMPLELIPLAQAEEKLAVLGFKGGWNSNEKKYIYVSSDKNETIELKQSAELGVTEVFYRASKGIIPSDAKGWLAHIPQNVEIPIKATQLTGINEITFTNAGIRTPESVASTYAEYIEMLKTLASGMDLMAMWGVPLGPSPAMGPSGYYGGIIMTYLYENNADEATLTINFRDHDENQPNPGDPNQPTPDVPAQLVRYLNLSDITQLHLIPQSQAVEILSEMGFYGTKQYDNGEEYILYTTDDKKESIVLGLNEDGLVAAISYRASKGIEPEGAKRWLAHIGESTYLSSWGEYLPFGGAWLGQYGDEMPHPKVDSYSDYTRVLDQITDGVHVEAIWEIPEEYLLEDFNVAYSVGIEYSYVNNKDQAILNIACLHKVEPEFPPED